MIQKEVEMVVLSNIYETKPKENQDASTFIPQYKCTASFTGGDAQVEMSKALFDDELPEGKYGVALFGFEWKEAEYWHFGSRKKAKGLFPTMLLGYTPVEIMTRKPQPPVEDVTGGKGK